MDLIAIFLTFPPILLNSHIKQQLVGCGKSVIYRIKNISNDVSVIKDYQNLQTWEYDSSKKYYYNGINFSDFTFYDIGDSTQEKQLAIGIPYYYGIGVNKTQTQILYYYVTID